jgi:hypothetical protein
LLVTCTTDPHESSKGKHRTPIGRLHETLFEGQS